MSRPRSTRTAACWVSSRSRRHRPGSRELHDWLAGFGTLARVGVEGTGAYGAGLARHLRGRGLVVIEVDRPNRQERRRNGKSDELDAIEAARAALSGRASGIAKSADGDVEAIRALLVARRSGRNVRDQVSEPDPPSRLHRTRRAARTAAGRARRPVWRAPRRRCVPPSGSDTVMYATKLAIATLGRRVLALDADAHTPRPMHSTTLVRRTRTEPARRLRRRHPHRRDLVGRRRRQPAPAAEAKPRSRTSAASRRSPRRRARPDAVTDSTPAGTAKRTMRCGGSCSPA